MDSLRAFTCPPRWQRAARLMALLVLVPLAARADEAAKVSTTATLETAGGGHAHGQLVDSPDEARLVWQAPGFAKPFRFPPAGVRGIHFPAPPKPAKAAGEYRFELSGGDVLFGSLVALDDAEAVLDCPDFGILHVERGRLGRIIRESASHLIFAGPNRLADWQVPGKPDGWVEDGDQLVSNTPGAVLQRNFNLPQKARFEIELGWSQPPDFDLALSVNLKVHANLPAPAFRLEAWQNKIVAVCETMRDADLAVVKALGSGAGSIQLQIFVDQAQGRMLVYSVAGQQLADLTVGPGPGQSGSAIELTNKTGNVRLQRLRIGRWSGEPPLAIELDKARILRNDGTILYGVLQAYDSQARRFTVRTADAEESIEQQQAQDICLGTDRQLAPAELRLVQFSGSQVSGNLLKVAEQKVWIRAPGIREPLGAAVDSLHALAVLQSADPPDLPSGRREGRLEIDGASLPGSLADADVLSGGPLAWQPRTAETASGLLPDASARIVYHEPAPPLPKAANMVVRQPARPQGLLGAVQALLTPPDNQPVQAGMSVLHLRPGDKIPCKVLRIDEEGVAFESDQTETKFVRHDQIKALELLPDTAPVKIVKAKRERLLTLPRMQRDSPPTQLIRSIDGDYVRGRLLELDDKQLKVEVRLEVRSLPRSNVARIIWLHADELTGAPPTAPSDVQAGTRVQALRGDGNRLTFFADQLKGSSLSGHNELLGACRVDLEQVDQLLIGRAIEEAAADITFHQWKLKAALDPLAITAGEGSSEGISSGLEGALVGKPAPYIGLDLVGGDRFSLSSHQGKVVVLDFWASWCGPCLQAMPQVEKVTREFADRGVELVAINLEETEDRVKAALERLELNLAVALDRDGKVAEEYGVKAIPQTVIIGRDGKVARLFVGGGARFDEQLRDALRSVLDDKPATESSPTAPEQEKSSE